MSVLSESPVPENGTPGSMRGMWRRGYGLAHRAPPNERGGNSDATAYGYRATSLLYTFAPLLSKFGHGNPPLEARGLEVEFFPKEEVLHEKVKIYR